MLVVCSDVKDHGSDRATPGQPTCIGMTEDSIVARDTLDCLSKDEPKTNGVESVSPGTITEIDLNF